MLGLFTKITRPRLRAFLEKYKVDRNAQVLDIGCGNSTYQDLFPTITTVDIEAREHYTPDHIADAHDLHMLSNNTFDIVLCTEVLEHLHTPHKALAEFLRILKPGGILLLSTRFVFPIHDAPGDYYRYTSYGLEHLCKDYDIIEIQPETGTMECLAVLFQRLGFQCNTLYFKPFKIFWFLLARLTLLCKPILTKQYGDIRKTIEVPEILISGYYLAAKKPL